MISSALTRGQPLISSTYARRTLAWCSIFFGVTGCSSSESPAGTDVGVSDTSVDSGMSDAGETGEVLADAAEAGPIDACKGVTTSTVTLDPKTSKESDLQKAFVAATPGTTIKLAEGTFKLTNTLSLATNCVKVVGAGIDKTTLDFSGQLAGSEGIYGDRSKAVTLEGFAVLNTKGNAIKILGGEDLIFRNVKTEWNGPDATSHGAYGVYPVSSKRVLIEGCVAIGASDSGIYVGQSEKVVVRRNRAEKNVAGIEIENTYDADVYENTATDNTAGLLVFDLPGLPQLGGHNTRLYKNNVKANNRRNFAPKGNIVGTVPAGIGFLVMANHDVEVFENTFDGNNSTNGAVVSYLVTQLEIKDPKYYPYPVKVHVHDNVFTNGGTSPDTEKDLGLLLAINKDAFPKGRVPDVLYDGILDKAVKGPDGNNMQICVRANKDATFAVLNLDKLPSGSFDVSKIMSVDAKPYECTLSALPSIAWPGLVP